MRTYGTLCQASAFPSTTDESSKKFLLVNRRRLVQLCGLALSQVAFKSEARIKTEAFVTGNRNILNLDGSTRRNIPSENVKSDVSRIRELTANAEESLDQGEYLKVTPVRSHF